MPKVLYTNISPITKAYTNINHMFIIRDQKPVKTYMSVWDSFVFESPLFKTGKEERYTRLQQSMEVLENLLTSLGIAPKTFYLSEAMARLFRDAELSPLYHKVLSKITMEDIRSGFRIRYSPFSTISLSRTNYIIADFLIAAFLPRLFPELCKTPPTHYLTSERFKVFHKKIQTVVGNEKLPKPVYVTDMPIVMSPRTSRIPSMEDSPTTLRKTLQEYFTAKKPSVKELTDLLKVLSRADRSPGKPLRKLSGLNPDELSEEFTVKMQHYFKRIEALSTNSPKKTGTIRIRRSGDFSRRVRPLNRIKLRILRYCDGKNTSLDISNRTGLKLPTVSTYFSRLRTQGLITKEKRPKRTADTIVIDLKGMS